MDDVDVALGCGARTRAISRSGDDRGDRGRVDGVPVAVDDEAPVGVAVEGEPEVGAVRDDRLLQVDEVRRHERVRLVVREGPVELEVQRHDLDRQLGQPGGLAEHGRNGEPAHPVARIHHDADRADAGQVDQRAQVCGVLGQHVHLAEAPGSATGGMPSARYAVARSRMAAQPGVEADALGAGAAELDAVVGGRVVAGREHRGRRVQVPGGEVALVGGAQPDRDDVGAARLRAAGEGGGELG